MLVAAKEPLALENLIWDVTGEAQPTFALSLGSPGAYRKLTVQVMRPNGEILGYIKLPLTAAATQRVRREAEVLARLAEFACLRPHIPKVLYADEWAHGYILFESRGPSGTGPVELGVAHEKFLQTLWSVQRVEKPGQMLVQEVAARWRKTEPLLDSRWRALGQAALERARRELDGMMIQCGVVHGDFAPWNTRLENGQLFVFDWESADWQAPTLWDIFHFQVQVRSLLGKKNGWPLGVSCRSSPRGLLILYLLNSAQEYLRAEAPASRSGIDFRGRLLTEELS